MRGSERSLFSRNVPRFDRRVELAGRALAAAVLAALPRGAQEHGRGDRGTSLVSISKFRARPIMLHRPRDKLTLLCCCDFN